MFLFKKIRSNALFLFIVASVTPLMLISFFILNEIHARLEKNIVGENIKMAAQVKKSIMSSIDFYKKQLFSLAEMDEIKTLDAKLQNPAIKIFFQLNPFFYNIHIYDKNGVLKNVMHPIEHDLNRAANDIKTLDDIPVQLSDAIKKAMMQKEPAISDFFTGSYGETSLCVAAPIFEFGSDSIVCGSVSAAAQLSDGNFHRFLDSVELYENEYILMVGNSGEVLTKRGKSIPYDLGRFDFDIYKNGRKINIFDLKKHTADGIAFIGDRKDLLFISPINELGAVLIIGRPYYEVFSTITVAVRYIIWITGLCLVFAITLGVAMSAKLSGPVERLSSGLNELGRGIYSKITGFQRKDELGEAVSAFNDLVDKMKKDSIIETTWKEKWRE